MGNGRGSCPTRCSWPPAAGSSTAPAARSTRWPCARPSPATLAATTTRSRGSTPAPSTARLPSALLDAPSSVRAGSPFVPLRVEFPMQEVEGTVFEGGGSLKLGTHCEGHQEYEQYTLREYLAYRIFNLLTPRSFRARLAKATHVDSISGKTVATRYAMFIESEGDVARRTEGRVVQLPRTLFRNLDPETLTLMMLFEYMIGNTDFSIFALHNVRLVQDQAGVLY